MCALCIDACDAVMDKLQRPRGLIRYESLDALNGKETRPLLRRPRVWVYSGILLLALSGITYGVVSIEAVELKVLHDRQPLFVQMSDGSIQNKYTLKVLNKTEHDLEVYVSASGPEGLVVMDADHPIHAGRGNVTPRTVLVRVPRESLSKESVPVSFRVATADGNPATAGERKSMFIGPGR
jgi:polyferredoxin